MSSQQFAVLLAAAILVFWMVGAYNRLVRLRNAIGAGWGQFDTQLQRRAVALPALLAALHSPLEAERAALESVGLAQRQAQAAADAVRAGPLRAGVAAGLVGALAQLDSTLVRLLALLDQQAELRGHADIAPCLRELHDVDLRLAFARQIFNDAVQTYNAAARQFPTRLLGSMVGFGPARPL